MGTRWSPTKTLYFFTCFSSVTPLNRHQENYSLTVVFSSLKIIFNYVRRQWLMFGGVWRSNDHDVQKVCLETCLCALVCFVKFYVFILNVIDVRDS